MAQQTLGRWTDRPTENLSSLQQKILEQVCEALLNEGCVDYGDDDNWRECIEKMLDNLGYHEDGYRYAKWLDDTFCWEGDTLLVDTLEDISSIAYRVVDAAVKEWAVGWEAAFKVQDRVRIKEGVGTVIRVDRERAKYSVMLPDADCRGMVTLVKNAEDVEGVE